ncbi:MAG: hypothetical protein MZV70_37470 [Desulfobacterales bacterium]|nr:hypothetical protein [Desulfobacterales bacterium]
MGRRVGDQLRAQAAGGGRAGAARGRAGPVDDRPRLSRPCHRRRRRRCRTIEASNCVFHHLAAQYPEVCRFDLALLAAFVGTPVEHQECVVRGGQVCRFGFRPAAPLAVSSGARLVRGEVNSP